MIKIFRDGKRITIDYDSEEQAIEDEIKLQTHLKIVEEIYKKKGYDPYGRAG